MSKLKVIAALLAFSNIAPASEEHLDMEFIEWLGQVTEIEELGVDIDQLLNEKSEDSQKESQEGSK